jgi:hypothetical protein
MGRICFGLQETAKLTPKVIFPPSINASSSKTTNASEDAGGG